jgi:hypothetical protein
MIDISRVRISPDKGNEGTGRGWEMRGALGEEGNKNQTIRPSGVLRNKSRPVM